MIAFIANIFGYVIRLIYNHSNYCVSIILFTILTKLILLPLYISQIKSTEEMNKIGPLAKKIQDKYKNDKEKQAEELTKLYAEHKVNPVAGCLPSLIQIPLILAMFYIVKQPLTYVLNVPQEQIQVYTQNYLNKEEVSQKEMKAYEINVANEYGLINMNVGSIINLGDSPKDVFNKEKNTNPVSLIIPILSVVFSMISIKIGQKNSNMTEEQLEMQKSMNLMMPLLSASVSYTMPLALGIYWVLGSGLSIIQQIFVNKYLKKDELLKLDNSKGGV